MTDTMQSAIILSIIDLAVVFAVLILLLAVVKILSLFSKEKVIVENQIQENPVIDSPRTQPLDSNYDEANTIEKYITVECADGSVKEIHFKEVE